MKISITGKGKSFLKWRKPLNASKKRWCNIKSKQIMPVPKLLESSIKIARKLFKTKTLQIPKLDIRKNLMIWLKQNKKKCFILMNIGTTKWINLMIKAKEFFANWILNTKRKWWPWECNYRNSSLKKLKNLISS